MLKKEKKDNIEKLVVILAPSALIFILTILSFTHFLAGMGLIVISLMFLFPLLFFLQGIYSAKKKVNILLSSITSIASYLIILFVFLNETALIYLAPYIVLVFLGYFFTIKYLPRKTNSAKKKK